MSKQRAHKWRIVFYIIGAVLLLTLKPAFNNSTSLGVFSLICSAFFLLVPTISAFSEVKLPREENTKHSRDISSIQGPPPPKGYTPYNPFNSKPEIDPSSGYSEPVNSSIPRYDYFDYTHLSFLPGSYVCVDLETTGLYPERDRITEVAAARVENGVVTETFSSLVHSTVPIDSFVSNLTGITNEMIADAPEESVIIRKLFSFIGNSPIVGYNVSFDVSFLHYAAYRASVPLVRDNFDVQGYAKKALPGRPGYKLSNVAEYLSIDHPNAHRALADVLTTVACAEKLRDVFAENERRKSIAEYDFQNASVDYKSFVPAVEHVDENSPLFGKRVVFTGTLSHMTRVDACQLVANLGGEPWGNVTKKTAYLVVGEGEASPHANNTGVTRKMLQADEWRAKGSAIRTITESEFFGMLDEYERSK